MREAARVKRVSVIAPMWNEEAHIEGFVADIAAQDFDGELELLVADGASSDGSVERLRGAAEREGIEVTVLDNLARWVSAGLNSCIRAATGGLIVRVDCHSRYPTDYVRRCVAAAEETGAENVGGIFIPVGRTGTERAVACAMNSPFGGIHWTRHGEASASRSTPCPTGPSHPVRSSGRGSSTRRSSATRTTSSTSGCASPAGRSCSTLRSGSSTRRAAASRASFGSTTSTGSGSRRS